jgi:hypothetical protein
MNLPNQSQPINRNHMGIQLDVTVGRTWIAPSSLARGCAGVPNNTIGACFGANGPIPGNFNCQACCALRGAISWQGGGYAVAC